MGLVQNDEAVTPQQRVQHSLAQQHPVGHVLQLRARRIGDILETDAVTDGAMADGSQTHFLGNARSHTNGSDTPWLGRGTGRGQLEVIVSLDSNKVTIPTSVEAKLYLKKLTATLVDSSRMQT